MKCFKLTANILGGRYGDRFSTDNPWYDQFHKAGLLEEVNCDDGSPAESESSAGVSDGEGVDPDSDQGPE